MANLPPANPTPYDDDDWRGYCETWTAMSAAARETLRALIIRGPLWDGDVPSKSGRDELLRLKLAAKIVVKREQGYQAANYIGWAVYRSGNPREFESAHKIALEAISSAKSKEKP